MVAYSEEIWDMRTKLYGLFQLKWMMEHGHGLTDLLEGLASRTDKDYIKTDEHDEPILDNDCIDVWAMYEDWEQEGFDGEIFPDFWEFVDNELLDEDIMLPMILNLPEPMQNKIYKTYCDYIRMERGA